MLFAVKTITVDQNGSIEEALRYTFVFQLIKKGSAGRSLATPAVEYRHKYLNRQPITMRKNPCFIVCTTTSPEESPSITSGLRLESVGSAGQAGFTYQALV